MGRMWVERLGCHWLPSFRLSDEPMISAGSRRRPHRLACRSESFPALGVDWLVVHDKMVWNWGWSSQPLIGNPYNRCINPYKLGLMKQICPNLVITNHQVGSCFPPPKKKPLNHLGVPKPMGKSAVPNHTPRVNGGHTFDGSENQGFPWDFHGVPFIKMNNWMFPKMVGFPPIIHWEIGFSIKKKNGVPLFLETPN